MISVWRMHLMDGLGHYVIHTGRIEKFLVITNNIMNLSYTYAERRIKKPLKFPPNSHPHRLAN